MGAHVETLRRLARRGGIPAYKIGKDWRFRKEALLCWAESQHLRRNSPVVLVIDDGAAVRNLTKRYLEANGYRVCLASDGTEGFMWLNRESVDLILLDLKMKGMDGPSFLRRFRREHGTLPVIVVTGYPEGGLIAEAMKYGPFSLLAKPFLEQQLLFAVRTVLNGSFSGQAEAL